MYKWLRNWRYDWRPEKSGAITGYRTTREPPTQRTSRLGRSEKITPNPSIRHALPPEIVVSWKRKLAECTMEMGRHILNDYQSRVASLEGQPAIAKTRKSGVELVTARLEDRMERRPAYRVLFSWSQLSRKRSISSIMGRAALIGLQSKHDQGAPFRVTIFSKRGWTGL